MKDRIIAFVGNWEPLAFRRRRASFDPATAADDYEAEHSDQTIADLKRLGVNWVITHFMKGFGLAAEAEEIEKTADFIRRCGAEDIGVGTYISSNIFYETFLKEDSDVDGSVGINYDGTKTIYFTQYFRWQWCYNAPRYVEYMHRTIDKAIEIDADLLHFDNLNWMPDYDYCHCGHCAAAFRKYLSEALTPEQRTRLLGFAETDHISPPPGINKIRLSDEIIRDPLMRLWIAFRAETMANVWHEFCEYAKSTKPDIRMEFNGEALASIYNHTKMGIDFDRMLPTSWAFWGEDGFAPEVHPNGCISGRFRSMKMAESYGSRFFGYAFKASGQDEPGRKANRLLLAEHLAFNNNCVADVGHFQVKSGAPDFRTLEPELKLLRQNEQYFADAVTDADVAVFRNFGSQAYLAITTMIAPYTIEQMLLLRSIPFDILMDSHLDRLSDYKVIFLAGTLCMSAEQKDAFGEYLTGGGVVVALGDAGKYDQLGMPAESLATACGLDIGDRAKPVETTVGKGRLCYRPFHHPQVVAEAIESGSFPNYKEVWAYYPSKLWDEPADADQIAALVEQAVGMRRISHDGPRTLICQLRRKDNSALLHLLQYNAAETIESVSVAINGLPKRIESIRRIDFDDPQPREVAFARQGDELTVKVEDLRVYALLILE